MARRAAVVVVGAVGAVALVVGAVAQNQIGSSAFVATASSIGVKSVLTWMSPNREFAGELRHPTQPLVRLR